jgi:hypothetical protein
MCIKRLPNQYRRPRPGKGCRATGKKKVLLKYVNTFQIMLLIKNTSA